MCSVYCVSEISNKEMDNAEDIDVIISMYNLIEYSDNYLKTSGNLQQYYRDEASIGNNRNIMDFPDDLIVLHLNINKK